MDMNYAIEGDIVKSDDGRLGSIESVSYDRWTKRTNIRVNWDDGTKGKVDADTLSLVYLGIDGQYHDASELLERRRRNSLRMGNYCAFCGASIGSRKYAAHLEKHHRGGKLYLPTPKSHGSIEGILESGVLEVVEPEVQS